MKEPIKKEEVIVVSEDQVTEVIVSMSQKMSTAQYETRDFFASVKMVKLQGQSVNELIDYGRKLVSKPVGEYYENVKNRIIEESNKK